MGRVEHRALGEVEKCFSYVGQRYGTLLDNWHGYVLVLINDFSNRRWR